MQVVTCMILVEVPFGLGTPILSCVLEQFCNLHFWQRCIRDGGEVLSAPVSAREAKTSSSAHTEKQIPPLTKARSKLAGSRDLRCLHDVDGKPLFSIMMCKENQ